MVSLRSLLVNYLTKEIIERTIFIHADLIKGDEQWKSDWIPRQWSRHEPIPECDLRTSTSRFGLLHVPVQRAHHTHCDTLDYQVFDIRPIQHFVPPVAQFSSSNVSFFTGASGFEWFRRLLARRSTRECSTRFCTQTRISLTRILLVSCMIFLKPKKRKLFEHGFEFSKKKCSGRILNRFSKDVHTMDDPLAFVFFEFFVVGWFLWFTGWHQVEIVHTYRKSL